MAAQEETANDITIFNIRKREDRRILGKTVGMDRRGVGVNG